MVKQGLAITLMALQVWQPVLAGVVATHPQVTQGSAANGVPVVNIATPGQSGISHNTYTRFDVDRQGLILNNSGQPVNTQLGGFIPGNVNLPGGGARLILNEVSGQLPSQLKGYMEVAGQKAELVIANPAGITCNGCGFINTSRGTLTTGKPLFGNDGSLSGFRVEEGALAIEGLGLNASNTDRVQLYSRALSLNAELHGRDLDVVTGRFEIDHRSGNITPLASNGTVPAAFAVDSSSLGGMYANRIRLVGTEAGVGMRLAAPVAALNGNLEITNNGDVRMVRASATQRVDISAQGNVGIDSDTVTGRDGISSGTATVLHAGGAVDLASGADITGATINITAASVTAASGTGIAARGALSMRAAQQHLGGNVASQQTITLSGDTIANHGQIAANTGFTVTASTLDNTGHISSVGGKGRLDVTGQLLNTNGVIEHGGALAITTASMDNTDGRIAANGMLSVTATEAGIDNSRGLLQGNAGVVITSPGLLNQAGEVAGNADIRLVLANGALDNRQGLIETRGTIDLQSGGVLQNADGRIHAGDDLDFALARFDRAAAGGDFVAGDHWQINADGDIVFNGDVVTLPGALTLDSRTGAITVDSRIEAGGPASLVAGSIRIGQQGFIATQDTLAATTTNLDNQGLLYGKTAVDLTVQGTFNNGAEHYKTDPALYRNAVVLSEGNINLTALNGKRMLAINNYGGHIESLRGDVTLKADQITNINIGWAPRDPYQSVSTTYSTSLAAWNAYNRGYAGEDVRVYQFHFTTTHHDVQRQGNRGQIVAARDITIEADTVENDRSSISAAANLWLDADRVTNTATHLRDRISKQTNYRYWDCYYNKVGKKKCGRTHQGSLGTSTYWGPEEADKTIKAVIEGGIDVVLNADTILNGEPVIRGSTSDIEGGQIPDVPGQAPQQAPPAGTINLGIVDPTSFPGFGLPGNGLFRRTAPGHPYLIETDPALNTYQGFLGSGYLLEHLEWSPQITQRRLGDSYYEVMLVRDALIASLGSRFVHPSITDERLQYEYLMENAIAASESLHLSAGVALSREQIDALQQDIVWLEERVIAGERVLVPVVYLAQGSPRVLHDGAVIGGGTVSLSGSTVRNAGLIRSREDLSIIAAQDISNLSGTMDAGGDLLLESGGDILNESGRLAGNNVTLQAKGDITHRTWTERERFGTADNGNWNTLIGDTAAVEARGTQVQIAGGNIQVVGGQLTGNSVALGAGGSILLDTVQVEQGYQFSGSDWEKSEQQVRHLQTQVLAARDLSLTAGADITAIAATLKAGTSATLDAGRDIHLLAAEETDYYEEHSRSEGSFGRSKSHDLVHDESRLRGTTITVGNADDPEAVPGQLTLTAGNDILLYASQAMATGQADVDAGGNLSLIAGINTVSHREQSSKESAATYRHNDQGYIEQTAAASAISAGGDLNLNAGKDIRLTASILHSDQTLRIGDEEVDPAALTATSPQRPLNVMVDTLALTNESWNETAKGLKGPLSDLVKVFSFAISPMVEFVGLGMVDMPELEVQSERSRHHATTTHSGSSLAGSDVRISALNAATFFNADIRAEHDLTVQAKDILLGVAENVHSEQSTSSGRSSAGKGRETTIHSQGLVDGTMLQAGNKLSLKADNDIVAVASRLEGDTVSLIAERGKVSLMAAYNTSSEQEQGKEGGYLTKAESQSSTFSATAVVNTIHAGSGGVLIQSSGNQTHEGTKISSAAGIELASLDGKVILGTVKDILQSQYSRSGDNGLVMTVKTGSEHHESVSMVQMESVVAPIIRASEGITVSLKEEAGASNENIDALVADLSRQPGMAWLADLQAQGQIDYDKVREIHESQHDTSRSMGLVASVVVAIAVTALTAGAGAGAGAAVMGTTAAGTTAATVSLGISTAASAMATSAAITGINATINSALNGDGLSGINDRLNSSEVVEGILIGGISAGITAGVGDYFFNVQSTGVSAASSNANKAFNLSSVSGFGEHFAYQLTTQATSAAVTAALKGDSVSDSLEGALTNAIGNSIGAVGFYQGANLAEHFGFAEGSIGRALIHAGTGAIVGEIMHDDAAGGAAGAFVSSLAGPGLEQLNASFGGSAAKLAGLVQATGALGAALLAGETSSVVAGQVTGALVDQYNRQLHTDEIKFLQDKDRIRRFASEYGLTESQAAKELARSAAGSMDAGWDQALSANDGDTSRGRAFLANEVKASGRTDLFQVTAAEYANERMGLQELFRDRNSINFMVGNVALVNPVTYRSDPRYRNVILDAKGRGSTDGIGEMLSGTWEAITHPIDTARAAVEGILNLPQSLSQGWEDFQYKGALDTLHVMQGDVYGVTYGNAKGSTQLGVSLVPASGLGLGAGRLLGRLGVDGDVVPNKALPDGIYADSQGVYGYLPREGSRYADPLYDFTDANFVARQREIRLDYLKGTDELEAAINNMRQLGSSPEEIANRVVLQRNSQKMWARDLMTPDEVSRLEAGNMKLYGDPVGPTPVQMFNKYGDWEVVIQKSMQKDPAINMLLGVGK